MVSWMLMFLEMQGLRIDEEFGDSSIDALTDQSLPRL